MLSDIPAATAVTKLRVALLDDGFQPVPIRNAVPGDPKSGKAPLGFGWQEEARQPIPDCCSRDADLCAMSTGIACEGLRVVDVDVDDQATADAAQAIAEAVLGVTPSIRSREGTGRRALIYRAAEG